MRTCTTAHSMMVLQDDYGNLVHKVRAFFLAAEQMFPQAQWFVKTDDDIFLSPGRVAYAAKQWTNRSAGAACKMLSLKAV